MKLFSGSFSAIEKGLDYSALKQKVVANNIANADTPNYKSKEVSFKKMFDETLADQMAAYRTDSRHFSFQSSQNHPAVVTNRNLSFNQNGNSVDVDKEMSDLATNQIYYNALVDRMSSKFNSLTNVIKGGR
ncbi:flagellar basal body rod protein FlgB [Pseudobacillus badius]|uniref:flagellar basal body rod protein FlgB n=1 Tax=Bacillus badius TaxID=1455 RepID=UPI0007B07273|nr:flagellar basal body rod protein FlgB [Bacillus badius]KZO01658.1 flagellar biosynthesis protein FlgB [Bacillus badius]OCS90053.1 flagellar basal-body rod protein FlgB [Bacillus badius]OVE53581.1 flagellar basal body rod protein FlgB [Bacillus badius]TDW05948.1 flagellar basal-body rod protein FlgB [Bacillus badius]UAT31811.1 flagellar basal body rod protein FlgB [Bacillus badius]